MAVTHFAGPLQSGPIQAGGSAAANVGTAVLAQTGTITQNSTSAVSLTVTLPSGAQITNIIVDVLTAFNSATTAVLTVGTAAAGTQYVTSVDAKTAGRASITHTAAQLLAMSNIGTNTSVVATVTPTGATSAGLVRVTVLYVQN
jgi:hypothetical protein